jgi:hypothetical protein
VNRIICFLIGLYRTLSHPVSCIESGTVITGHDYHEVAGCLRGCWVLKCRRCGRVSA